MALSTNNNKQKMGYKEDTPYEVICSNTTYIPKKGWYTVGEFVFKEENNIINQKNVNLKYLL